ncbi:alpha/beta hydrolase-fold protein [Shewanella algae]|uniref:alpha/beta hydrolase n=1 Tax=Shewanella algae TaxID=38313 RepID=UPI00313B2419
METKHTKLYHLLKWGAGLGLLCLSQLVQADEGKTEADIRWQALSPIANLYLSQANAEDFIAQGDNEKSRYNNYAGALAYYLMATERDSSNIWAPYQAAGTLAMLELKEQAIEMLLQADSRGLWQYIMLEEDDELNAIRDSDEYRTVLKNSQSRYLQHAKDTGKAYIYQPKGSAPKDGWPVLVWLSGYGTEGSDSVHMAKLLTSERAIFIGINGTEKLNEHSFRWATTETESSHQAVQQALAKAAKNSPVNNQKVALMGFSQGALHSAHLLAKHPNDYVGALLLSAGGMQTELKASAPTGKRLVISYGEQEHSSNLALDKQLEQFFSPGNQLQLKPHQGGHFFDDAWQQKYPDYVNFVLELN